MPRDGSGIYHRPVGTDAVPDTTIESAKYNVNIADVESDLNLPRPIVAGGTNATSVDAALSNLSAEKAKQVVTDFNTAVLVPGTFNASNASTNSPVGGHAFSGLVYGVDANNTVIEARDSTDGTMWVRRMTAGVWGAWAQDPTSGSVDTSIANKAVRYDVAQTLTAPQQVQARTNINISGSAVVYDAAQTLTSAQKAQARANIDVLKKNYIINGGMMVSQENGTTASGNSPYYPADQFSINFTGTSGVYSAQQVAAFTPSGSPNRMRITVTAADAAVAATDIVWIEQRIEGLRVADLRFGNAAAKTVTIQFGVKAPAGTYTVAIENLATNRGYAAEYVIAAGEANTDVVKSVTIAGDTTGTWPSDNTSGMSIRWGLMAGSTYQQAAGSWGTISVVGSTNQFNFMGTGGNVFELFDVGLYEGNVAPPFMVPDYASELLACQRYAQVLLFSSIGGYGTAGMTQTYYLAGRPIMRASPTLSGITAATLINCSAAFSALQPSYLRLDITNTSAGAGYVQSGNYLLNARL